MSEKRRFLRTRNGSCACSVSVPPFVIHYFTCSLPPPWKIAGRHIRSSSIRSPSQVPPSFLSEGCDMLDSRKSILHAAAPIAGNATWSAMSEHMKSLYGNNEHISGGRRTAAGKRPPYPTTSIRVNLLTDRENAASRFMELHIQSHIIEGNRILQRFCSPVLVALGRRVKQVGVRLKN